MCKFIFWGEGDGSLLANTARFLLLVEFLFLLLHHIWWYSEITPGSMLRNPLGGTQEIICDAEIKSGLSTCKVGTLISVLFLCPKLIFWIVFLSSAASYSLVICFNICARFDVNKHINTHAQYLWQFYIIENNTNDSLLPQVFYFDFWATLGGT